jgi:hypothetical protein
MTHCPRCQSLLPEPPERFCPNCGADLEIAPTMPPPPVPPPPPSPGLPAGGWAPAEGRREGTPWERRDRIGFAAALVETTQQVLTAPTAFFRAMPVTGGIGAPLLYAILLGYAGLVVSAIYDFVLTTVTGSTFGSFGGTNEAVDRMMPYIQGGFGLGLKLVLGPVILIVMLFLMAGIVHLGLMMVGGAARGFEATLRVACYSEAAAIFHVIPLCGQVLAAVYMIVLMVIGLSEAHGTTRGKAAFAVLLPIFLCCCCIFVPIVAFVMSLASQVK